MKQNEDVVHECGEIAASHADEINKIHQEYEQRIKELEQRILYLEAALATTATERDQWRLACEQYKSNKPDLTWLGIDGKRFGPIKFTGYTLDEEGVKNGR